MGRLRGSTGNDVIAGGIDFRIEEGKDNGRVLLRLDQFPKAVRRRLHATITRLTHELLAKVEAAEPVRTGTLRQQTHAYVDEGISRGGQWIRGRVRVLRHEVSGVNYGKVAGALEYGAPGRRGTGKVAVAGHTRGRAMVRGYERRRPTIRAMRFLRGPALAQRARALAQLEAALGDAIKDQNFRK